MPCCLRGKKHQYFCFPQFHCILLVGVGVLQVEHAAERYKILQSNAESYRKEIAALQDKCQKYSTSIAKHEQTITKLKEVKRANTAHDVYFRSCKGKHSS